MAVEPALAALRHSFSYHRKGIWALEQCFPSAPPRHGGRWLTSTLLLQPYINMINTIFFFLIFYLLIKTSLISYLHFSSNASK
jgi:hypothetical protein